MKARVATWRGGDPDAIKRNLDEIRSRSESGPPEGVPSVGLMILQREGEVLFISLFETEDDLRQGDATLNEMSPPGGGMGDRSVEFYDVPIKLEAQKA
jgi:hypothetical protein